MRSMNTTSRLRSLLSNSLLLKVFTAHIRPQNSREALNAEIAATACYHRVIVYEGAIVQAGFIAAAWEICRISNKTEGQCQSQSNDEFGRSAMNGLRIKTNGEKRHSLSF